MNGQTAFHTVTCAQLAAMEFPPLSPEPARVPTWGELVKAEPGLMAVERLALTFHRKARGADLPTYFDYGGGLDVRDWGRIKRAFMPLVGYSARRHELRNSTCYDVVYDHLLALWEGE